MVYTVIFEMASGPDVIMLRTADERAAREKADRLRTAIHKAGGKSQVRIGIEHAR